MGYIPHTMGSFLFFFASWWGLILQAIAIVHFIRRRPETYWLFIILIGGWLGALVYIAVEVIPDAGLLRTEFQAFPRRRRIRELERAILDNPSAGNYEELGLLYLDDGNSARARACYDQAIAARTDSPDPFYRRGVAEVALGDFAAAVPDLEHAVSADPAFDFHRAIGLLAHAYAQTGQPEKADALFQQATKVSTISETYYNYALFLHSQGRNEEAREWAQKILDKRPTMPAYQRRRERSWFRKAQTLLLRLRI
ncbi:MAG: tetratricopeptide repeat protein [Candidatus Sulfotelmatobacter sp.]